MNGLEIVFGVVIVAIVYFMGIKIGRNQVEEGLDFWGREIE